MCINTVVYFTLHCWTSKAKLWIGLTPNKYFWLVKLGKNGCFLGQAKDGEV